MVHRPSDTNAFEFVMLAALRTAQLMSGCEARVPASHRSMLTAQLEIVAGKVRAEPRADGLLTPKPTGRFIPGELHPLISRR